MHQGVSEGFEQFRQHVLKDRNLQKALRGIEDRSRFINLVVQFGRECGIALSEEDVQSALDAGRKAWLERYL